MYKSFVGNKEGQAKYEEHDSYRCDEQQYHSLNVFLIILISTVRTYYNHDFLSWIQFQYSSYFWMQVERSLNHDIEYSKIRFSPVYRNIY